LGQQPRSSPPASEDALRLVHELQVHQIELELQNHALLEIRAQLEQSLEKYTDLYDFSPAGYFTLAHDGTIQDVNLAGATLLATDRSHLIGKRFGLFVTDQTRPGFNAFLERMQSGATREYCEVAIEDPVAPPCHLHLQGVGLEGDTGWQYRISALDITERKQMEQALRLSEEKYRTVADFTSDWEYWRDPEGHYRYVSPACERIAGYRPADFIANPALMLAIVHPDDQARIAQHFASKTALDEALDFRIRTRAGEERWISHVCQAVYSMDGRWLGQRGSNRDITEYKKTAIALRASEERYRQLFSTLISGFALHEMLYDAQGQPDDYRFLEVNPAFEQLTGLCAADLIGKTVRQALPGIESFWIKTYGQVALTGESTHFEYYAQALNKYFEVVAYRPKTGQFACLFTDISDRKRTEAALRESENRYRSLFENMINGFAYCRMLFAEGQPQDFIYLKVNNAFEQLTGLSDVIGKRVTEVIPGIRESTPELFTIYGRVASTGVAERFEIYLQPLRIWLAVSAYSSQSGYFAAIFDNISERKQAEQHIAHLAYHDPLTQLPNRLLLTDRLQQAMAQSLRDQRRLVVCYLDLDNFKPINDVWGHAQGDRVLIDIAQRLSQCVRAGDTVARMGGDEFVLLFKGLLDIEECERALDRVMRTLQTPFSVAGQPALLSASLGVTLYPDDQSDADGLLRHADQAMYVAKQTGGNRYQLFDPDYDRRARSYREIRQRVQQGLSDGEFQLYYQPKVDMRQGAVIGAEALIRWRHPDEGLLTPARFMPAVDVDEVSTAVGEWVLNEALRQMAVWAAQGLRLPVSVNLSGRHLQQPGFVTRLQTALATHPTVPPDWLELEILETAALEDLSATSQLIEECRRLGVRFSLDDFGTGYSSLTYLKHLPVHLLKIDQSFVRDMLTDGEALAIVRGVIGLSLAFHRDVIAEGVETDEHSCALLRLGCNLVQGYSVARPMPPELIPGWVAGWKPLPAWRNQDDRA
ncbi:MAG: EAL domain-containing protein, partial [Candidatus Contendobacter sp.]|nr:EAL domain-containing protein [Candidatus Contendobacter sp.]